MGLSLPHILILAVVAALLLGGGRFSALMGDVAKGVKNFKKGMADEDHATTTTLTPPAAPLIEGRTAADIIAEHERSKAAAARTPNDPIA
jgi:sec-independent protein translocase protein TatA